MESEPIPRLQEQYKYWLEQKEFALRALETARRNLRRLELQINNQARFDTAWQEPAPVEHLPIWE